MAEMAREKLTVRDYLELPETNQIVELLHGEIVVNPPKDLHQKTSLSTLRVLISLVTTGELRHAPTGVQLDDENFVEPDIFWVSGADSRCQLGEDGYWHGAPDLVVEIFSPGTANRDKITKFRLYEKHGVREYWMVDPLSEYIEVWRLEGGKFAPVGVFAPGDSFTSTVLGEQSVSVEALFKS